VILLTALWFFLSYFKFSYEKRAWIDDFITGISLRIKAIPAYWLPYPRYEVVGENGDRYYYAFVEGFTSEAKETMMGRKNVDSSAINLKTLFGEDRNLDFLNSDIIFFLGKTV